MRELSEIISVLNKLRFKFVGLDTYAGGDQTLSYAKDGIKLILPHLSLMLALVEL